MTTRLADKRIDLESGVLATQRTKCQLLRSRHKRRLFGLAFTWLVALNLAACGEASDTTDIGNGSVASPNAATNQFLQIGLVSRNEHAGDELTIKTGGPGPNLIDSDGRWLTWSGAASGVEYDATTRRLIIDSPANGADMTIGVRRFDRPLNQGASYTFYLDSSDQGPAAVLFLYDSQGRIVSINSDAPSELNLASLGKALNFVAPANVTGFYVQVQSRWQADAPASVFAELRSAPFSEFAGPGGSLIDMQGPWLSEDGAATPIWYFALTRRIELPAPSGSNDYLIGIHHFDTALVAGTQYQFSAPGSNESSPSARLTLSDAAGQHIPFTDPSGTITPWLTTSNNDPKYFVAPEGVVGFTVQLQSPYQAEFETFMAPALVPMAGESLTCNRLRSGDFESGIQNWNTSGSLTISTDSLGGFQAAQLTAGWISRHVPTTALATNLTLSGFLKTSNENDIILLGIDFLDSSGQQRSQRVSPWPAPRTSNTVVPNGYRSFELNLEVPAQTATLGLWIYTSGAILLDNLKLESTGCLEAEK